jgi:biotin carboxylase
MKKKLAIIGASIGQYPLCQKAAELGIETFCFAWEKGAVCKDIVDHFYPISIIEMDRIVECCRTHKIDGVISNASDSTAEVVAYIAEKLHLNGPPYRTLLNLHDKYKVRKLVQSIEDLKSPNFYKYDGVNKHIYPCVVKPCNGGGKKGVSFAQNDNEFDEAVQYASLNNEFGILVEEFIEGKELSIECISYHGEHRVIQITDKDSSSAPHFVELGHHQPAEISQRLRDKIEKVIPTLLSILGYTDGASHIEVKYKGDDLYLIEANLRGGGDDISNKLVFMSSGIDYLKCMIDVALNQFVEPDKKAKEAFAGIYYLTKQTSYLLPFFKEATGKDWLVEKEIYSTDLKESHSNYERNGFLLYYSDHKITPNN